jgi:regulator of protease activity HflC (stomatin/prohibitin superfamily)
LVLKRLIVSGCAGGQADATGPLQIAQTTLRSGVDQVDLDTLLFRREQRNVRLQTIIDEQTEPSGVKVTIVEVKDVELPHSGTE